MTNDGGRAFPAALSIEKEFIGSDGMSLRDWFAGEALNGVLAANAHPSSCGAIPVDDGGALFVAEYCYRYADAMLKAREASRG